jgi:cytochrome b subunit of formate dehydrogenase
VAKKKSVNWTKNFKNEKKIPKFQNYKIYKKILGWFAVLLTLMITIVKLSKPLTSMTYSKKNEYRQRTPILNP